MSFLRKIGKGILVASEGAKKMDEGFDRLFGEDRTRPGDSFSKERAGRRAGEFTRQARENNRDKTGGILDKNKDTDFFGKSDDESDEQRFF